MKRKDALLLAFYFLLQIVLAVLYYGEQAQLDVDCAEYERQALECYAAGCWYPAPAHLHETWIQSVGMVNYLLLQYRLFGTFALGTVLNLLLSVGILWHIFHLARHFFSLRTARFAVLLHCLVLSNLFLPIHGLTELPFLFLCLSGFRLGLSERHGPLAAAGLCYALAYTFRPMALAFLLATLVWHAAKRRVLRPAVLLAPFLLVVGGVGLHSRLNTGYFVTSATTGGFNLLMTANDRATGSPQLALYNDTAYLGYIPNARELTFHEKDSIWTARAVDWIRCHPARYAALYARKLLLLHGEESWAFPFIHSSYQRLGELPADADQAVAKAYGRERSRLRLVRIGCSLFYLLLLPAFLAALFRLRRSIFSRRGILLLIWLTGTLGTCLFSVEPRYHYPYLFVIVIWVAALLAGEKPGDAKKSI